MADQSDNQQQPDFAKLRLVEPARSRESASVASAAKPEQAPAVPAHPAGDLVKPLRDKVDGVLDLLAPQPGLKDAHDPALTKEEARLVLKTALDVMDKARTFAPDREGVTITHDSDRSRSGTVQPGDYSFRVDLVNQPSPGTISRTGIVGMSVWDGGDQLVASYDRGWNEKPKSGSKDATAVERVIDNCRDRMSKQVMDRRGHERSRDHDGRGR